MERWKPVVGFEGYYEVSDWGRLRSLDRQIVTRSGKQKPYKGKIISLHHHVTGYVMAILHKNRFKKTAKIHRLVAEAFIPNPEGKPDVNHLNGIKDDNRLENLEWATASENILHAIHVTQTMKYKQASGVLCVQEDTRRVMMFPSIRRTVDYLQIPKHWLLYHMERGTPFRGYYFTRKSKISRMLTEFEEII